MQSGWKLRCAAVLMVVTGAAQAQGDVAAPSAPGRCDTALNELGLRVAVPSLSLLPVRKRACDCLAASPPAPAASAAEPGASPAYAATVQRCVASAIADTPLPEFPLRTLHALSSAFRGAAAPTAPARAPTPVAIRTQTCKMPAYPALAAQTNTMGTSKLVFRVDAKGKLIDADVFATSGRTLSHKLLDASAMVALMQCEFTAATENGEGVEGSTVVDYVWRLQ